MYYLLFSPNSLNFRVGYLKMILESDLFVCQLKMSSPITMHFAKLICC
jgi:hypothetical protein